MSSAWVSLLECQQRWRKRAMWQPMNQSYRPFWGDLKKLVCIGFTGLPHHVGGRLIVVSFCFFVLLMFEKGTNMKEKTEDLLNKAWVSHVSTIEVVHVSMFPKQERSIYDPPIRMAFCGRLTLFFCFPIKIAIWWAYWVYCVHFRIFTLKTFLVPSAIFCPIPLVRGEEKRLILWGSAPVSLLGNKPAQ